MKRGLELAVALAVWFCAHAALAHHTAAGVATPMVGNQRFIYQADGVAPPSQIYLSYSASRIDNSLGYLHSVVLGGEWAVHRRFSLLANLPVSHLRHELREDATGLGDLALGGRVMVVSGQHAFAFFSSTWSFPTGDHDNGFGLGAVGQQMDFFNGYHVRRWLLFVNPAVGLSYGSDTDPVFNVSVGATTPVIAEHLFFSLAMSMQVYTRSDTFEGVPSSLYVDPQINWGIDHEQHWIISLGGRARLIDNMRVANFAGLETNAALSDIDWRITAGLTYNFGTKHVNCDCGCDD